MQPVTLLELISNHSAPETCLVVLPLPWLIRFLMVCLLFSLFGWKIVVEIPVWCDHCSAEPDGPVAVYSATPFLIEVTPKKTRQQIQTRPVWDWNLWLPQQQLHDHSPNNNHSKSVQMPAPDSSCWNPFHPPYIQQQQQRRHLSSRPTPRWTPRFPPLAPGARGVRDGRLRGRLQAEHRRVLGWCEETRGLDRSTLQLANMELEFTTSLCFGTWSSQGLCPSTSDVFFWCISSSPIPTSL